MLSDGIAVALHAFSRDPDKILTAYQSLSPTAKGNSSDLEPT